MRRHAKHAVLQRLNVKMLRQLLGAVDREAMADSRILADVAAAVLAVVRAHESDADIALSGCAVVLQLAEYGH
eukprot:4716134-Prorocentrum_lima.AAC.1